MVRRFLRHNIALLCAVAAAIITIAVFMPAVRNGYLMTWDDDVYVRSNEHIRSLDPGLVKWAFTTFYGANYWHPLTWLSHAVDYALWGAGPAGHHLTNIILHGLNAALVVMLLYSLLSAGYGIPGNSPKLRYLSRKAAALTAAVLSGLLFGLHPLRAESVAWIAERKDVLCAFFSLLSIWSYVSYAGGAAGAPRPRAGSRIAAGKYAASILFLALALLSKPMAVTVPAVFLILDWAVFRRPTTLRSVIYEKLPFYFLSLGAASVSIYAKHSLNDIVSYGVIPLSSRLLTGFHAILFYLSKTLWPANLLPFYPYPGPAALRSLQYIMPVLLVAVITAACIALARKHRLWLGVWSYYVISLLPVLPFMIVGEAPVADRFSYLPSLGPLLLAGVAGTAALDRIFAAKRWAIGLRSLSLFVLAGVFILLSSLTIRQINYQKDDLTLWNHEIESAALTNGEGGRYLNYYLAYSKRGLALAESGRLEEAVMDYEHVLRARPDFAPLRVFTGILYFRLGRYNEAVQEFQTAAALDPADEEAHRDLGVMYYNQGRSRAALQEFSAAIRLRPDSIEGHFGLANTLYAAGDFGAAIEQYKKVLDLAPDFVKARNNLGSAYLRTGRRDEAINEFRSAVNSVPGSALIHKNLAAAYQSAGLKEKASQEYEIIQRIEPGFTPDRNVALAVIIN
jgi:tetratricopeptide (TPR) repeat protein